MGESVPTVRNRQNLCDWILGFHTHEVKAKKSGFRNPPKGLNSKRFPQRAASAWLCIICGKAFRGRWKTPLRSWNLGAYFRVGLVGVLSSMPRTIIAAGSSFCHIFRDIIR